MIIEFELSDILLLVNNYWNIQQNEEEFFVFDPNSDTSFFLITKILSSFGYRIMSDIIYEDQYIFITNLKYSDICDRCSDCDNNCNRLSLDEIEIYDSHSEPEEDDDNRNN